MKRAVILANGDISEPQAVQGWVEAADLIVAADGGIIHAAGLGLTVDILVGDFDSAPRELVQIARSAGADVREFPREKDFTDLELAVAAARDAGCDEAVIIGALGGRLDHALANVFLMAGSAAEGLRMMIVESEYVIHLVRDQVHISGSVGDIVSLLAINGPVLGVRTSGLKYELSGGGLQPGSSLGVSNLMTEAQAKVSIESGTLLAVHVRAEPPSLDANCG